MPDTLGLIVASTVTTELGNVAPAGLVVLRNQGPAPVFVLTDYASSTRSEPLTASYAASAGWTLAPGQEMQVLVPTYPVAADTRVPAMVAPAGSEPCLVGYSLLRAE